MHQYFIIESNDYLGESGFYLSKDDSVVWLDLAKPSINFYYGPIYDRRTRFLFPK